MMLSGGSIVSHFFLVNALLYTMAVIEVGGSIVLHFFLLNA